MSLERFRPAWQQFKLHQTFDRLTQDEILAMIAEQPRVNRHRSVIVNLMMLLTLLMACY